MIDYKEFLIKEGRNAEPMIGKHLPEFYLAENLADFLDNKKIIKPTEAKASFSLSHLINGFAYITVQDSVIYKGEAAAGEKMSKNLIDIFNPAKFDWGFLRNGIKGELEKTKEKVISAKLVDLTAETDAYVHPELIADRKLENDQRLYQLAFLYNPSDGKVWIYDFRSQPDSASKENASYTTMQQIKKRRAENKNKE